MYEYVDFYDEAETGCPDGGPIMLSLKQVIRMLKRHGFTKPGEWLTYFKESNLLHADKYPATSLLKWLGY